MPGPGLAGPGHRRGFRAATTPGHRGCVECPDCLAEGVGQERRAGGCYGAGRIRRDHAQTYFELSPPPPAIAPTRSAKTPRPITMPVPPAFITVPIPSTPWPGLGLPLGPDQSGRAGSTVDGVERRHIVRTRLTE